MPYPAAMPATVARQPFNRSPGQAPRGGMMDERSFEFRPETRPGSKVEVCDNGKPTLPLLPLHLLHSEDDAPGRTAPSGSTGMKLSSSTGSLDAFGFSDTASMASFAMSSATLAYDGPQDMRAPLPPMPDCFRCPISNMMMEDPVLLADGRTCERANLHALRYKGKVQEDAKLRSAIKAYCELRKEAERRQKEWQSFVAEREKKVYQKLLQRQHQARALRIAIQQTQNKMQELVLKRKMEGNLSSKSLASTVEGEHGEEAETSASDSLPSSGRATASEERTASEQATSSDRSTSNREANKSADDQESPTEGPTPQWRSGAAPRAARPSAEGAPRRQWLSWFGGHRERR